MMIIFMKDNKGEYRMHDNLKGVLSDKMDLIEDKKIHTNEMKCECRIINTVKVIL